MKMLVGVLAISCIAFQAQAGQEITRPSDTAEIVHELISSQREVDAATAQIRSRADLYRYLQVTPKSPINKLPADIRQRFLDSLVFTKHGLASYSYIGLGEAISVTDLYRILSLFGEQNSIGIVPHLTPMNNVEESMLILSPQGEGDPPWSGEDDPIKDAVCLVESGGNPETQCIYQYGNYCNAKCD